MDGWVVGCAVDCTVVSYSVDEWFFGENAEDSTHVMMFFTEGKMFGYRFDNELWKGG